MTSQVEICNLALTNIGKQNLIASIDEASTEALYCRQFYQHTLKLLLAAYPWSFAGKTVALAALVTNDRPEVWPYAYARLPDCLKIRAVTNGTTMPIMSRDGGINGSWPYLVDGGYIYTSLSPAYLHYTYAVDDAAMFSAPFVEAFAWALSVRLAMPLTRDGKIRADAQAIAQQMLAIAGAHDANEGLNNAGFVPEMIEARE